MRLNDNDSGSFNAGANIAFTGNNTHAGSESFNGPQLYGRQSFSANGTISATGASVVEFTGSTASQTINLPASPAAGLAYEFVNNASVAVTLSGNGLNIDGASTVSIPTLGAVQLTADSGGWHSSSLNQQVGDGRYGRLATANTWTSTQTFSGQITASSALSQQGRWLWASQAFTTNGSAQTIGAGITAAAYLLISGSTASSSFTLPASPTASQVYIIKNAASVTISIAGNGNNIESSANLSMTSGQCRWIRWNGTQWDIVGGYA